jgi:hypothetical protein
VLEGEEVSVEAVTRASATLPLMTRRRLVIVRRAHLLPTREREALTAYARDPNPTTCLLLLADEVLPAARAASITGSWARCRPRPSWACRSGVGRGVEDWLKQRAAADGTHDRRRRRAAAGAVGRRRRRAPPGEARKAALAGGPDNRRVGVSEVTAIVGEHG